VRPRVAGGVLRRHRFERGNVPAPLPAGYRDNQSPSSVHRPPVRLCPAECHARASHGVAMMDLDLLEQELPTLASRYAELRQFFPALNQMRDGRLPIFLDGPGGTQVPQQVIDAMVRYLKTCNANHGGAFATSRESDAILAAAHVAMADLLHAPSPDEIVFGANMTSLTLHFTRAISKTL